MKLSHFSSVLALTAALFSFPATQAQGTVEDSLPVDTPLYAGTCSPDGVSTLVLSENNDLFLHDWYSEQEPVISFFSTYSLTPEEQAGYLAFIQMFWPGVYDNMQPWEVNDEMADVINTMVETIANCSQGLAAVDTLKAAWTSFRAPGQLVNPATWANFILENYPDILQAVGIIRYNRRHGHCVTVASANWRSTFEMAYGQYWWY